MHTFTYLIQAVGTTQVFCHSTDGITNQFIRQTSGVPIITIATHLPAHPGSSGTAIQLPAEGHVLVPHLGMKTDPVCRKPVLWVMLTDQESLKVALKHLYYQNKTHICLAYCRWFAPCARHSVRLTYRSSSALRLLGSLRISPKNCHV